jgi:DNA-binding response OmpR family regulator
MTELKLLNHYKRVNILIVDDDRVTADILKDLASAGGADRYVSVCYDGTEAVDRLKSVSFDLIITDLVMPGLGGLDVLRRAKQINPESLVIIVTGYASLETTVLAIKEGAYDYILKPCKLDEIRIVVDRAVDKIYLNRENRELLRKLQDAYDELLLLHNKRERSEKTASLNFFSSSMAGLHYLHNNITPTNYLDKLHMLSSLREKGMLTENEFKAFKKHYITMLDTEAAAERQADER